MRRIVIGLWLLAFLAAGCAEDKSAPNAPPFTEKQKPQPNPQPNPPGNKKTGPQTG